jgi:sarcosine oxidase, subunit gamma
MAEELARSPLDGRLDALARIGAELVPFLAQVDLRIDPSLADRAPFPLPVEPNTAIDDGHRAALWLGPDEWLILGRPGDERAITDELEAAFRGAHRSIVDVSANRVAIELAGADRSELLSCVCSLDLEPPAWNAGRCAQTLVGRAQAILQERESSTGILVRPSFADYVVDLLMAARDAMDVRP